MSSRRIPRPLLDRVSFAVSQLGHHSATSLRDALSGIGLHPRHFGMLVHLARYEGSTQQHLADLLAVHRNVMVGLVDELEERGLVERRRHPDDRRAYALHLTARARELLPQAERIADRHDRDLCRPLSSDERTTLLDLLTRMAAHEGLGDGVHPGLQR